MPNADQVLTAAQMRAAEAALIGAGTSVDELMQRAGRGAAEWVWRMAAGRSVTVLCGPGNNGGDGYVIAEALRERGGAVSVVVAAEPQTEAARTARSLFKGAVVGPSATPPTLRQAQGDRLLVDCLFGTGLTRLLSDEHLALLIRLAASHRQRIAIDLPSGVDSDSGAALNENLPQYDLTIALGAWKWAHWMMPAAQFMGHRKLVEIGVDASAQRNYTTGQVLRRPALTRPRPNAHKYTRGLLVIVAGDMPGAALLAARAAQHAGAGYVKILSDGQALRAPDDVVIDSRPLSEALGDPRISAILIGCGLGRGEVARNRLHDVVGSMSAAPIVLDGDALHLIEPIGLPSGRKVILTPHEGELATLAAAYRLPDCKPPLPWKVNRAIELNWANCSIIVAKGPDTIVFDPDQGLAVAPMGSSWLSTAGSGDVLAGAIASRLATGADAFTAACQGVWLHGEAARLAGPAFTASELASAIKPALASCL